jgi:hypothetical protein
LLEKGESRRQNKIKSNFGLLPKLPYFEVYYPGNISIQEISLSTLIPRGGGQVYVEYLIPIYSFSLDLGAQKLQI